MPKETMTPRERWEAVLRRQKPDRVPMDYWATGEATHKLKAYLGTDDMETVYRKLHIDPLLGVGGRYVGPAAPAGEDIFGCRFRTIAYATGTYTECIYNPLARFSSVEEIEKEYRWPEHDWWTYDHIKAEADARPDLPVRGGGSEPFLKYCQLRGLEQGFIDLVENPEIVHFCLDKLFDFTYENTRRIYEQIPGRVLVSYVAEDMGSQEGLLFSPKQINEFLFPRMKRMMDLVHSAGAFVFHHSDGAVRPLIPGLLAIGMDVLNPVQWRCQGMDRAELKREFGDRLIFHAAVDNQQTLAFGTPAGRARRGDLQPRSARRGRRLYHRAVP